MLKKSGATHVLLMTQDSKTGAKNRVHFSGTGFRRQFSIPHASGMKIFGARNKHIKAILYSA